MKTFQESERLAYIEGRTDEAIALGLLCDSYPLPAPDAVRMRNDLFTEGKTCTKCGETKPFSEFYATGTKRGTGGVRGACKTCDSTEAKRFRAVHLDRYRAAARVRRAENIDTERVRIREASKKRNQELADSYIASRLQMPVADCPPELLKVKAAHLRLLREVKRKLENEER